MVLPVENAVPVPTPVGGVANAEGNAAAFLALLSALLGESARGPSPVRPEVPVDAPKQRPAMERNGDEPSETPVTPIIAPLLHRPPDGNVALPSLGVVDGDPAGSLPTENPAAIASPSGPAGETGWAGARPQEALAEASVGRSAAWWVETAAILRPAVTAAAAETGSSSSDAAPEAGSERGTAVPAPGSATEPQGRPMTDGIAAPGRVAEATGESVTAIDRAFQTVSHQSPTTEPASEARGSRPAEDLGEAVLAVEEADRRGGTRGNGAREARGPRRAGEPAAVQTVATSATAGGRDRPVAPEVVAGAVVQVREQVVRALERGARTIRVRLEPPDLGTVDIRVRELGGRLEVTLAASRPEVQQALEAGREGLRTTLAASGFTVQRVEVQPTLASSGYGTLAGGQPGMGWGGAQQGSAGDPSPWRAAVAGSEPVPSGERPSWSLEPEGSGLVDTRV
ncbi:MAG: flagellar hook-length control protein FliK [Thermomicrobium sp.]|nr:flagellar hook-length control protein FliK [Thermomicrobium sp.]